MTRWRVTYASGRHLTVMATDEAHARVQAALRFQGDAVVEVSRWEKESPPVKGAWIEMAGSVLVRARQIESRVIKSAADPTPPMCSW